MNTAPVSACCSNTWSAPTSAPIYFCVGLSKFFVDLYEMADMGVCTYVYVCAFVFAYGRPLWYHGLPLWLRAQSYEVNALAPYGEGLMVTRPAPIVTGLVPQAQARWLCLKFFLKETREAVSPTGSPQDCFRYPPTSRRNCVQGDWNGLPLSRAWGGFPMSGCRFGA